MDLLWISFYHKRVSRRIKKQFTGLGENTGKYIYFTVPIEQKATKIDKNEEEITKNISYRFKFIDGASLLIVHVSEELHRITGELEYNDKKCETCRIRYKYCDC